MPCQYGFTLEIKSTQIRNFAVSQNITATASTTKTTQQQKQRVKLKKGNFVPKAETFGIKLLDKEKMSYKIKIR